MTVSRLVASLLLGSAAAAPPRGVPERYYSMDGAAVVGRGRSGLSSPPASAKAPVPAPRFVPQRQDHFDGSNPNMWQQAYYVNDAHWKEGSEAPVFLCVGGEGPPMDGSAVVSSEHCNVAVEWLEETGALMFALEHRYYGCHNAAACPVSDLTAPGALRFHSSRQALADLAGFVEFANQKYQLTSANRWVTWGGSYPGMLAGWARLKFPQLIYASVSSSAPVRAELDMRGYNDVVAQAYAVEGQRVGGSAACRQAIAEGHRQIGKHFGTRVGRDLLARTFGKWPEWYADSEHQADFAGYGVAYFPAQDNDPACTEAFCNIAKICALMTDSSAGDAVQRLAQLRKGQGQPASKVEAVRAKVDETPTPGYDGGSQLWPWQTCTEFGFYQTCEKDTECFFTQGLSTLDSQMSFCTSLFNISKETVQSNIAYSNTYYGADHPEGSRVLYVNGEVDPWHANSINYGLSKQLPAFQVKGASHHAWTHPSMKSDQDSVVVAREHIRSVIQAWLEQDTEVAKERLV